MVNAIGYTLAFFILIFACQFVIAIFALPVVLIIHFYKQKTKDTEKAKLHKLKRERKKIEKQEKHRIREQEKYIRRQQKKNARQMKIESHKQQQALQEKFSKSSCYQNLNEAHQNHGFISYVPKKKISKKRNMDEMTGVQFENYVADIFRRKGYKVKTTPTTGDFGADLILSSKNDIICVQCKRYSKPVGIRAVQEVTSAKQYYHCTKAAVVTNSRFTEQAYKLAKANNVSLYDRQWILRNF